METSDIETSDIETSDIETSDIETSDIETSDIEESKNGTSYIEMPVHNVVAIASENRKIEDLCPVPKKDSRFPIIYIMLNRVSEIKDYPIRPYYFIPFQSYRISK